MGWVAVRGGTISPDSAIAFERRDWSCRVVIAEAMHRLGRHYIAARYPDAHASGPPGSHYTESDAVAAIADSEAIAQFIDRGWRAIRG